MFDPGGEQGKPLPLVVVIGSRSAFGHAVVLREEPDPSHLCCVVPSVGEGDMKQSTVEVVREACRVARQGQQNRRTSRRRTRPTVTKEAKSSPR